MNSLQLSNNDGDNGRLTYPVLPRLLSPPSNQSLPNSNALLQQESLSPPPRRPSSLSSSSSSCSTLNNNSIRILSCLGTSQEDNNKSQLCQYYSGPPHVRQNDKWSCGYRNIQMMIGGLVSLLKYEKDERIRNNNNNKKNNDKDGIDCYNEEIENTLKNHFHNKNRDTFLAVVGCDNYDNNKNHDTVDGTENENYNDGSCYYVDTHYDGKRMLWRNPEQQRQKRQRFDHFQAQPLQNERELEKISKRQPLYHKQQQQYPQSQQYIQSQQQQQQQPQKERNREEEEVRSLQQQLKESQQQQQQHLFHHPGNYSNSIPPFHHHPQQHTTTTLNLPTITSIQTTLQKSWSQGYDPIGASHYHHNILHKQYCIGAMEAATYLHYLGYDIAVSQFVNCDLSRNCLWEFVIGYFEGVADDDYCSYCYNDDDHDNDHDNDNDVDNDNDGNLESPATLMTLRLLRHAERIEEEEEERRRRSKSQQSEHERKRKNESAVTNSLVTPSPSFSSASSLRKQHVCECDHRHRSLPPTPPPPRPPLYLQWEGHSVTVVGVITTTTHHHRRPYLSSNLLSPSKNHGKTTGIEIGKRGVEVESKIGKVEEEEEEEKEIEETKELLIFDPLLPSPSTSKSLLVSPSNEVFKSNKVASKLPFIHVASAPTIIATAMMTPPEAVISSSSLSSSSFCPASPSLSSASLSSIPPPPFSSSLSSPSSSSSS